MINYIVKPKRNLQTGTLKYYAQIAKVVPLTLNSVIEIISLRTTIASADVKAVLDSLQSVTLRMVKEGHSVRLGDLGSFRPTLTSKPADSPDMVTTDKIKSVRVRFTKGTWLQQNMLPIYCQFRRTDVNGNPNSAAETTA